MSIWYRYETNMKEFPSSCNRCEAWLFGKCRLPDKKNSLSIKSIYILKRHVDCPLVEVNENE